MFPKIDFPDFHGLSIDSRNIAKGDIFIPLKGEEFNGHNYIIDARELKHLYHIFIQSQPRNFYMI